METEQQKYPIVRDISEPLKIFYFAIRPKGSPTIPNERFIGIVAYRAEDALSVAIKQWTPPNSNLIASMHVPCDYSYVSDILNYVNKPKIDNLEIKPVEKEMGLEGFKAGLEMLIDKYISNEKHKKWQREIIKNI